MSEDDLVMGGVNKPLTGIEMIARERQEQIEKHKHNDGEETWYLTMLAQYIMLDDSDAEKDNLADYLFGPYSTAKIPLSTKNKFDHKSHRDRLVIAGALIAAEIDRLSLVKSE